MRLPWHKPKSPTEPKAHIHDKVDWRGDKWQRDPVTQEIYHVVRWLCSCGEVWVEGRPIDEFPHLSQAFHDQG